MHNIEIPEKHIVLKFASCIEEMKQADFIYMMKLLVQHQSGLITEDDFRNLFLARLLNVKKTVSYLLMKDDQKEQLHDNFSRICELLDSFYLKDVVEGKEVLALNLNFIRNMIRKVGKYYGPDDALTNVSFFEYKEAYNYFNEYNQVHNEMDLSRMIAVLYRPKRKFLWLLKLLPNYSGQLRQSFTSKSNPLRFEQRVKYFSKVPTHIRLGIYLWFNSCVKYLRDGKPTVDGVEIDFSILYQGSDDKSNPGIGLMGILFSMSEGKVFGDLFDTANTNIYDIFTRLYQLKLEYDNQKPLKK